MKTQFKVNDKVRITGNSSRHHLKVGSICTVISGEDKTYGYLVKDGDYDWWVKDYEMEFVSRNYSVSEEMLKEAHKEACPELKTKIESIAPELFNNKKAVVGKWYKIEKWLIKFSSYGNGCNCGFSAYGEWSDRMGFHEGDADIEATSSEIESHLIKEAEKRGYKAGVKYISVNFDNECVVKKDFEYYRGTDNLTDGCGGSVYCKGKWATIIPQDKVRLTLEDIAKLKGVDVSLIEIVK